MALTNAEKQARFRQRRKAELSALRAALSSKISLSDIESAMKSESIARLRASIDAWEKENVPSSFNH